jgi:hypothetical protein
MTAIGKMFSPNVKTPELPKPVRMATATDPDILAAGARARETALKRKGRLSTLLTDPSGNPSSSDYTRETLG